MLLFPPRRRWCVGVCASAVREIGISDARRARALLCVGFLLVCSSMATSAGAQTVVATDLGTLPGDTYSSATALNVNGQVVGYSAYIDASGSPVPHAFSWTPSGGMLALGTLPGGSHSSANAVNANGQVVGYSTYTDAAGNAGQHAFSWTPS